MNARKIALELLVEYELEGKYINLSLTSHKADRLTPENRAFLTKLLYTSVERKITYDYYIASLSGRGIDEIDVTTKNILRLGFCQILDMDKVPDFAAVSETVSLARNKGERAFVNGILRRAVRERDSLPMPDKDKNYKRYLSVKYSFPLWIVKHFCSLLGEEKAEEFFKAHLSVAPTSLSVNTTKISAEDYLEKLIKAGYTASISEHSDISVIITDSVDPRSLQGYSEGEFFVQDSACALAVSLLGIKEGDTVIDVCSAPGGKSFLASILAKDNVRVISYDLHESKISLIEDGAKRLGLKSIEAKAHDALSADGEFIGLADRVICDVPCSGLGVLRKKPDLRYRSKEGVLALPELQYSILKESSRYLKPGGRLLYSTCTLNPAENGDVVKRFLLENEGFSQISVSEDKTLTLYPHIHKTDGFFIAILEKDR